MTRVQGLEMKGFSVQGLGLRLRLKIFRVSAFNCRVKGLL